MPLSEGILKRLMAWHFVTLICFPNFLILVFKKNKITHFFPLTLTVHKNLKDLVKFCDLLNSCFCFSDGFGTLWLHLPGITECTTTPDLHGTLTQFYIPYNFFPVPDKLKMKCLQVIIFIFCVFLDRVSL